MIKNIIFDLGGVILTHKGTLVEDMLSIIFDVSVDVAKSHYLKYKDELRTGNINSRIFIAKLKKELRSLKTIDTLLKEWQYEYKKIALINENLLALIDKLSNKYSIYLMTDTIDLHDQYNSKRGIYDYFKLVIKSHDEGVKKPDQKAFHNVLQKIKAQADECCFIDDLEENIIVAEKIGMKGILYKNEKQLEQDLGKIGVKI